MSELLLLRHAKSSWADAGQADIDRSLNARGRQAAEVMGRVIAVRGLLPTLVICSPAARTRETWDIARQQLPAQPRLVIVDALYDFGSGDRLLDAIQAHGGAASRLLLVGHNPAIQSLTMRLAGMGNAKLRQRITEKYPTGALTVLDFDSVDWAGFGKHRGQLMDFIRPCDVAGDDDD